MPRTTRCLALCLMLAACPLSATAQEPVIPADEFVSCTVCHGVQLMGNPVLRAPRLSRMAPWYVERQLQAFKNGWRGTHEDDVAGREMQPMAVALSDDQIVVVAAYVAATRSEFPRETLTGDPDKGRIRYGACAVCHGAAGEGNEALGAPALAGANGWYLVAQLRHFRSGSRGSHREDARGMQMREAARTLPDAAIADVVAFIATVTP